jgi:hypothetical protein
VIHAWPETLGTPSVPKLVSMRTAAPIATLRPVATRGETAAGPLTWRSSSEPLTLALQSNECGCHPDESCAHVSRDVEPSPAQAAPPPDSGST